MAKTSLDRLAHIANLSHDLQHLDSSLEADPKSEDEDRLKDHSAPPDDYNPKPRRLACTGCRQQKSKCDASERHPLPCTRCMKKNIQCSTEPDFKRTDKTQRLASIERELKQLKDAFVNPGAEYMKSPMYALSPRPNSPRPNSPRPNSPRPNSPRPNSPRQNTPQQDSPIINASREISPYDRLTPQLQEHEGPIPGYHPTTFTGVPSNPRNPHNPINSQNHEFSNPPNTGISNGLPNSDGLAGPAGISGPEPDLFCEEKSLGDITLDSNLIRDLYMEYMQNYHPMLPVIDVSKGPERIHRLCPALFWVIMFVALRRINDSKKLLLGLTPHIKNILAEITISPISRYNPTETDEPIMNACSVYSVQAFLLYTLWPPLTSSLSADSSWNTIGVALFQAIRIGLHSSGDHLKHLKHSQNMPQSTGLSSMAQEQTRTWILCNIVSQNIATAFGFPAFVQFDFLSAQHCSLSTETRHIMELAHFEDQVAKTLNMGSSSHTGVLDIKDRVALLKVLINQLSDLEIKHSTESQTSHPNQNVSSNLQNHSHHSTSSNGYTKFHSIVARIHLLTCYFLDAEHLPPFELSKGLVRLFYAAVSLIEHVQMCEAKTKDFVKYLPVVQILNLWQASCVIVKLANSPLKSALDMHASRETYTVAIRLVAKASVLKHDIAYRASGIMRNMWQLFRTLDEKNMTGFVLKTRSRMMASVFFDCLSIMRDQVGMAKLNIKTDPGAKDESGDSGDEAIVSSEEESPQKPVSSKTTPGSSGSSSTRRKKRTLSGVQDAESKARRIIRTIPLDPQPIAASNRGSIFKVLNSDTSSPNVRAEESPSMSGLRSSPKNFDYRKEMDFSSLFDMNNESLWKNVDSLMNDFAFPG